MTRAFWSLMVFFPLVAHADVLPLPLPGEMPLHRIGYELVFEVLAASAAGAAAVRALVKRRWKIRDELSAAERDEFSQRIDSALPRLTDEVVKSRKANERKLHELVVKCLAENRELAEQTDGLPLELICKSVYDCGFDPRTPFVDRLKLVVPTLIRAVADAGYVRLRNQKTLLEGVLSQDGRMQKELDGVPIELINEALVSRLPQEICIAEDLGAGSLWTTEEDRREVLETCRKRYRRPGRGGRVSELTVLKTAWLDQKEKLDQKHARSLEK